VRLLKGATKGGMGSLARYVAWLYINFFGPCLTVFTVSRTFNSFVITVTITTFPYSFMSSTVCAGCNHRFTHAGYSRHLSMTTRSRCRSHYIHHLKPSTMISHPGVSGPADVNPRAASGPELGEPSKCIHGLNHANELTPRSR